MLFLGYSKLNHISDMILVKKFEKLASEKIDWSTKNFKLFVFSMSLLPSD